MNNELRRISCIIKAFHLWEENDVVDYADRILSPFAFANRWLCCWCV